MLKLSALGVRDFLLAAADSLYLKGADFASSGSPEGILVIRADAIGDATVWLDAARQLKQYYQDTLITLVANAQWADLIARTPYIDRVIPVRLRDFRFDLRYRYLVFQRLRKHRYKKAIHFIHDRRDGRFADAECILRAVRAEEKVGPASTEARKWRQRWSKNWYTKFIPPPDEPLMELQRNARFLRHLGIESAQAGVPILPSENLPDVDGLPNDFYVVVPGAGVDYRRWPVNRFAEIADRIHANTGWTGVVCGAPSERILGDRLIQYATSRIENWAGRTTVSEMADIVAKANLVVGNETGSIHVATAVSTPSVCVLGGGHYGRFVPYCVSGTDRPLPQEAIHKMECFNCDWKCIFSVSEGNPVPCINRVQVKDVWERVAGILPVRCA